MEREGRRRRWRGHGGDTRGDTGVPSALTVSSVRSEGDEDLEPFVSILDGGQGEEGAGRLPKIGDQALCGDGGVRIGWGTSPPSYHLPVHPSVFPTILTSDLKDIVSRFLAAVVGCGAGVDAGVLMAHGRQSQDVPFCPGTCWQLPFQLRQSRVGGSAAIGWPPPPALHPHPCIPPSHLTPGDLWHREAGCQAGQNSYRTHRDLLHLWLPGDLGGG